MLRPLPRCSSRLGVLLVLLLAASSSARGEGPQRALVLPVEQIGRMREAARWRQEFALRLTEELRNSGVTVVPEHPARVCRDADCMASLAASYHVDLVVGSKVVNDGQVPPNFFVRVWAYDSKRPGSLLGDVERKYPNGTESEAAQALAKQLGEALAGSAAQPLAAPPKPDPSNAPSSSSVDQHRATGATDESASGRAKSEQVQRLRARRRLYLAMIGTSVVAAAGVTLTIVGSRDIDVDNKPVCGDSTPRSLCPQVADTGRVGIGLLVPGVALTVGAAVLLGVEGSRLLRLRRADMYAAPTVSGNHAGLVLGGRW